MARLKVAVIGSGLYPRIAAQHARANGHLVRIFDDAADDGLDAPVRVHLDDSAKFRKFLASLSVPCCTYSVSSGVLTTGGVQNSRRILRSELDDAYWRKTRKVAKSNARQKGFSDLEAIPRTRAVQIEFRDLVARLRRIQVEGVSRFCAREYDVVLYGWPLWRMDELFAAPDGCDWQTSSAAAVTTYAWRVRAERHRYMKWDVVYAPYTPSQAVHRFYHHLDGFTVEVNGAVDMGSLISDLNFIFYNGWQPIYGKAFQRHGHILPMAEKPCMPAGVVPIDRLSSWAERFSIKELFDKINFLER